MSCGLRVEPFPMSDALKQDLFRLGDLWNDGLARFGGPFLAGEHFTADQPTWNSAAVVLAAHALGGDGPTAGLFRGEGLPVGLSAEELLAAGVEIERERAS